jgi:hypothetical protein
MFRKKAAKKAKKSWQLDLEDEGESEAAPSEAFQLLKVLCMLR